jgi:nicotinate-nucleotide adenylyltransferase
MPSEELGKHGPNKPMARPLPPLLPHMLVGLFGGSFDPPHAGHLQVSRGVQTALGLNKMIWLVSPQNPLKTRQASPLEARLKACDAITHNTREIVSDIESQWRCDYAIDTITEFQRRYPACRFIWVIGSDNFASLHQWRSWQEIMHKIPIAIYPRPGSVITAGLSQAAQQFSAYRCAPAALAHRRGPAWAILSAPRRSEASHIIRARKD